MEQSKFLSVAIAACLLFCSADVFAQRSRAGSGSSGGRVENSPRTVSRVSPSSGSSSNSSSGSSSTRICSYSGSRSTKKSVYRTFDGHKPDNTHVTVANCTPGLYYNLGTTKVATNSSSYGYADPSSADYFSTNDVLNSSCPNFGFEVSKRKATKESLLISSQEGDVYYRDGIFFSQSKGNSHKYEIFKPNSGLHVPVLPASSRVYEFEGVSYYYYYGTYYVFDDSKNEYVVVTPPVGLVVDLLPCDAKEVMVDDDHYIITDNVLYKVVDSDNEVKYEVARLDKETMYLIKDYLASARRQQMVMDWKLYSEK